MSKQQITQVLTVLVWGYTVLAAVLSGVAAFFLENRLKRRLPNTKPFKWGFYVASTGVACLPLTALCLIAALGNALDNDWDNFAEMLGYAAWSGVCGISGLFIIWRKRWAWIVGTISSCNPVWWLINWRYGRNRWQEFTEEAAALTGKGRPVARVTVGSAAAVDASPKPQIPALPVKLPSRSLYVHLKGEAKGPFTTEQLKALLAVETVSPETPCCHEGADGWQTVAAYVVADG